MSGALGYLSTNGNTIQFSVILLPYVWTGATNGNWDLTTMNWLQAGFAINYSNGTFVIFDDTAAGPTSVTNVGVAQPAGVTITNSSKAYSILSSGGNGIGGSGGLTKSGTGSLTLSGGANTYTGVTTVRGGTLSAGMLTNGGLASDIGAASSAAANVVLNGGTLQYTGPGVSMDRLFSVDTGGGTIDASGSGAMLFTNSGLVGRSGSGTSVLALTGVNPGTNTLAALLADSSAGGATSLTKSGTGRWILTGSNTYSGVTTISAGTLQVGAGGASGSLAGGNIINNSVLAFNRSGQLTIDAIISGSGFVTMDGSGTVFLLVTTPIQVAPPSTAAR